MSKLGYLAQRRAQAVAAYASACRAHRRRAGLGRKLSRVTTALLREEIRAARTPKPRAAADAPDLFNL